MKDMKEKSSLNDAITEVFGEDVTVLSRRPVSGGDINRAYALELSNGEKLFLKANLKNNIGFFRAEAKGLAAMRGTKAVKVPDVLAIGTDEENSFLLLEHIESGRRTKRSAEELGRGLAKMHLADALLFSRGGKYGFTEDNYIGAGRQINTPKESWIGFFRECRLLPQIRWADAYLDRGDRKKLDLLLGKLENYLEEPEKPALLHGDLWGGNVMFGVEGEPWLIDPAVYVGHPEADLAMTELFGGFEQSFYAAYKEAVGIAPEYKERRDLYNLYHLLNHLNLFGGSYLYSVKAVVGRYV